MSDSPYLVVKSSLQMPAPSCAGVRLDYLDIELTERCNSNCIHCCINRAANDAKALAAEMTTDEVKDVLLQAVALGCIQVRFTGGEPLLRDDFVELYIFARKLGLKVLVFTNAMLITESMAQLWARIPPLVFIEVSIYGMAQASCEKITRTPGSFEAAKKGVGWLLRYNVPFVVKGIFGFWDASEIKAFENWALTIPWMEHPIRYSMFFDLSVRREEARDSWIRQIRVLPEEGVKHLERSRDFYIKRMKQFVSKFMGPPGDLLFTCNMGCGGCVDAYGKFQLCMLLRDPACTVDVKRESLKSALEGVFSELRQRRAQNPEYLRRCARCFLKGLCDMCPAKSWVEHGALDTPVEYLCQVAHVQAGRLGLITENESGWEVNNYKERISLFVNH